MKKYNDYGEITEEWEEIRGYIHIIIKLLEEIRDKDKYPNCGPR